MLNTVIITISKFNFNFPKSFTYENNGYKLYLKIKSSKNIYK